MSAWDWSIWAMAALAMLISLSALIFSLTVSRRRAQRYQRMIEVRDDFLEKYLRAANTLKETRCPICGAPVAIFLPFPSREEIP